MKEGAFGSPNTGWCNCGSFSSQHTKTVSELSRTRQECDAWSGELVQPGQVLQDPVGWSSREAQVGVSGETDVSPSWWAQCFWMSVIPFQAVKPVVGGWLWTWYVGQQDWLRVLIKPDFVVFGVLAQWSGQRSGDNRLCGMQPGRAGPDSHSLAGSMASEGAERHNGSREKSWGIHGWLRSKLPCGPCDNIQFTQTSKGRERARERTCWTQTFQLSSPLFTS